MGLTLAAVLAVDLVVVLVLASLLAPWLVAVHGGLLAAGFAISPAGWWALVLAVGVGAIAWLHLDFARTRLLAAVAAGSAGTDTRTDADAGSATDAHPELRARLTRLAAAADVEPPSLRVLDTDVPNSLAVGGPRSGTVVVSEGLLDRLDGDELDAVLAHELAHVKNRDAAVVTLASFLPAMAARAPTPFSKRTVALACAVVVVVHAVGALVAGSVVALTVEPVGISTAGPVSAASIIGAAPFVLFALLFGGVVLGVLATPVLVLGGRLSRDREFAADRAGALLSGSPAALATALETLDDAVKAPETDARDVDGSAEKSLAPSEATPTLPEAARGLCLLPHGFDGSPDGEDRHTTRSHPPVEERIARLRELVAEDGTSVTH